MTQEQCHIQNKYKKQQSIMETKKSYYLRYQKKTLNQNLANSLQQDHPLAPISSRRQHFPKHQIQSPNPQHGLEKRPYQMIIDFNLKRQDSFMSRNTVKSRQSIDKATRRHFCQKCGRLAMPFVTCSYCSNRKSFMAADYFGSSKSTWRNMQCSLERMPARRV